jgi:hypothetical protein
MTTVPNSNTTSTKSNWSTCRVVANFNFNVYS